MSITEILILALGLSVLIGGGELLVRGASAIALRLDISRLVVGLTIVAFGTSAPELFISVQSALKGSADMAMGNVVGSNICNLALVLGLTAVITHIPVENSSIRVDWPVAMGSAIVLYAFAWLGPINMFEGIFFLCCIAVYVVYTVRASRQQTKDRQQLEEGEEADHSIPATPAQWAKDVLFVLIGCVGLYYGSEWFVGTAEKVFTNMGVSQRVVGIMVLAVGTSLPELVTSVVAAIRKNTDIALGNLIGSNIFNILCILGITGIIQPIEVSAPMRDIDMVWMLGVTLLVLPFMVFKKKIVRWQGAVLLAVYAYYVYLVIIA